jgi:hypothetical protein
MNKNDILEEKLLEGIPIRYDPREDAAATSDDGSSARKAPRFLDFDGETLHGLDKEKDAEEYKRRLERAQQYFQSQFLSLVPERTMKGAENPVYVRFSTATDPNNVKFLFESCKDVVLSESLRNSGFLGDDDDEDY